MKEYLESFFGWLARPRIATLASWMAFFASLLPVLTATLQLVILIFGVGAGYWAWRANRAKALKLEREGRRQNLDYCDCHDAKEDGE